VRVKLVAALALTLALAPAAARATAARAGGCNAGDEVALGDANLAYAATVRRHARAYRSPEKRPFASFGRLNVNGVPTVFGVLAAHYGAGCRPLWYRVLLPMRPNQVTGYVRADTVRITKTSVRAVIDLSERRVYVFRAGAEVLRSPAAIGAKATPTPLGHYYVNQKLRPANPRGPYGPAAIGISAFSPVLVHWAQGGPVAIHGTNAPWSIGRPVSNGCIRVPNAVIRRLWQAMPPGTPVLIRR
jgi:lipoprotein-anchoring transpeptidase ErfK/SrfK